NGFVFDGGGAPSAGSGVTIHYPANGTLTSSTTTTDSSGFYQFTDIPFGMRSVTLELTTLFLVSGSVMTGGGANEHVEFRVVNRSSSPITVHSLIATFTPVSGPAYYDEVKWAGTRVFKCAGLPKASGDTVIFSADQTVAAGGTGTPPVMVPVAGSVVQVTDITIQGAGTEARIELKAFFDDGSGCKKGAKVDMRGATFSDVTLRDPSNAIVGQFSFTVP
ncbi:MAG: hypothetical protein ACE5KY_05520, partial [Candidatus Tectimicrobiota bacterium]